MNFIALDVETANPDMSSICQIGIVEYKNGKLVNEWKTLVNPEDYFDEMNISIHGITESMVQDAPTIPDIYQELQAHLSNKITAHHTHFDKVSLNRALTNYGLPLIDARWLDTARLARRTWEQVSKSGYGLKNIASNILGFEFKHHDALEDAKACAQILLGAEKENNASLEELISITYKTGSANYQKTITKEGNTDGALFGENLVFTGSLQIPRREASELASRLGCNVSNSVKKTTSILVVGDQDISKLAGKNKSSKHRKAEEMIKKGHDIRILAESDFVQLLEAQEV